MVDVLKDKVLEYKLYNNTGFVRLRDCMPRLVPSKTADYAVPEMARISYAATKPEGESKQSNESDERLINYLLRNYHTSPFEGISFKFVMRIPIFVARQLLRHRTAKVNEYSMRYSPAIDAFYFPDPRIQDKKNKQGSVEMSEVKGIDAAEDKKATEITEIWDNSKDLVAKLYENYNSLLKLGVAREVARCTLPVCQMTELYYEMDLHNLLKMLRLRMDIHAQKEIRELADAMYKLIVPIVPLCTAAFENYWVGSMNLSKEEQKLMSLIDGDDITEGDGQKEYIQKLAKQHKIKITEREIEEFLDKFVKIFDV